MSGLCGYLEIMKNAVMSIAGPLCENLSLVVQASSKMASIFQYGIVVIGKLLIRIDRSVRRGDDV